MIIAFDLGHIWMVYWFSLLYFQFKPEFCVKELIIWAIVSSRSYFFWLYRASPSLAAKNIINLISVLTIWWCPCIESFLVFLEKGVCYDQCVLLTKLLAFTLLHFFLQGQTCYFKYLLTSYFCIPILFDKKHVFGVSSRTSCRSS